MATQKGLDRVAQINATIAKQGMAAPNPTGGQNYYGGSGGGTPNPSDAPGYDPRQDSTTKYYDPNYQPTAVAPKVDTSQPSPQSVNATPFTAKKETPIAPVQATPEQVKMVNDAAAQVKQLSASVNPELSQKYNSALNTLNTSQQEVAFNGGQAMGKVQQAVKEATPQAAADYTYVNDTFQQDPIFDKILQSFTDYLSPKQQQTSLMQEYQNLIQSSGLNSINQELINTQKIIDGTEDDIRNEVTAASGFATESQVLALASARNKNLIKNYNALLATRDNLQQQVTTMMNLNVQDRQMANQRIEQQLNVGFKMLEYRDKFRDNAKSNYEIIRQSQGWSGLLASAGGDPNTLSNMAKVYGTDINGLIKLASMPPSLEEQLKMEQIKTQKIQQAKTLQDLNTGNTPTIKTINGVDMQWNPQTSQWTTPTTSTTGGQTEQQKKTNEQLTFLRQTADNALKKVDAAGRSGLRRKAESWFVGDTDYTQLESYVNTLKTNVLALSTDPNIKKFFGPQMSNADVLLMTSAGTTLNPEANAPDQMKAEIGRLEDLFLRMQKSIPDNGVVLRSPDGKQGVNLSDLTDQQIKEAIANGWK